MLSITYVYKSMPNDKTMNQENINGVMLSLQITGNGQKSRTFTVSYKSRRNKYPWWRKCSIIGALFLNVLTLFYFQTSLTVIVIITTVLSFLVFLWITHSVQSESLLVIPSVGIQSSVKYVCGREDNFISWASLDDVVINEIIKMNRVLYKLTIITKTNSDDNSTSSPIKLIPLFKYTKPRLTMLEMIYSELQTLLIEAKKESGSEAKNESGSEANIESGSGDKE